MKKFIPNTITCLNLFSGILAVLAAYNGEFYFVLFFVLLSAIFDFFDGFAARALKAYSPLGKELDSLADMVSFGFLPGMIAFTMLNDALAASELGDYSIIAYAAFLLTVFSALRLAKFNIDERQSESFIGLATPANALFWTGLACLSYNIAIPFWIILILVLLFSYLLVAEIPMFSLKFKSLKWNENVYRYIFLIGVLILIVSFTYLSLLFIILWYLILSFYIYISHFFKK